MDKLPFVDSHVHFYDMAHPVLRYSHWQPGYVHPVVGDQMKALGERNFTADDFIALTRSSGVAKAIHIECTDGTRDPVVETEWLEEAARRTGFPHAIVARADLRDPRVEAVLERHCTYARVKGIRDFSYGDYLVEPDFHRGFGLLAKFGLMASLSVQWQDMEKLRALAGKSPNTIIVIDHAGFPAKRTAEYFADWKRGMATAAQADNIICKISGLGMGDNRWTVESIRPYVLWCIEKFGVKRCIFATNWPVDSLWSSYDAIVDAYRQIIWGFTTAEQAAMLAGNAERLYGI